MTARPLHPVGHIAGNLDILATMIASRMRRAPEDRRFVLWVDDDGCVYLAASNHARAQAMLRYSSEQRIGIYCKPTGKAFPCTARDLRAELDEARDSHAARALAQSRECAA